MSYICRAFVSLVWAVGYPCLAQSSQSSEVASDLKINVLTFNYVRGLRVVVSNAEKEATKIFRKIGVDLVWVDCYPHSTERSTNPACGLLPDSSTLTLNIHRWFNRSESMMLAENNMGYAVRSADRAGVACNYVEKLAGSSADQAQILGHVMAHEIGHLLLDSTQHSENGIMRAVWWAKDLEAIGRGNLIFTPPQAEHIRANLLGRIKQRKAKLNFSSSAP